MPKLRKAKKAAARPAKKSGFKEFLSWMERIFDFVTCPVRNWSCTRFFFWVVIFPFFCMVVWRIASWIMSWVFDFWLWRLISALVGIVFEPSTAITKLEQTILPIFLSEASIKAVKEFFTDMADKNQQAGGGGWAQFWGIVFNVNCEDGSVRRGICTCTAPKVLNAAKNACV